MIAISGSADSNCGRSRLRILFLASSADRYGSDRALAELAAGLAELGCTVAVVAPHPGPLAGELEGAGIRMSVAPLFVVDRSLSRRAVVQLVRSLLRPSAALLELGRSFAPNVVYSNTSHVLDGPALARALGAHHVWHLREIERVPATARRAFGKFLLVTGERVFAISEAVLAAYFPRSRQTALVARDGVNVERYRSTDRYKAPETFTGERPLRLLSIGRVTPWKGQDVAARAAVELAANGVPVLLRILGHAVTSADKLYAATLRDLANSSNGVVELRPEVDDVRPQYEWCDIVVHTAVKPEPFGRVVVEAMAARRLVVASAAGGPLETIDPANDGYLVPPGNAGSLASLLGELAVDPRRLERRAAACSDRAEHFSVASTTRRVLHELRALSSADGVNGFHG